MSGQLSSLLTPPDPLRAQQHSANLLSSACPRPTIASKLATHLSPLLVSEQGKSDQLAEQLVQSTVAVDNSLRTTKHQLVTVLSQTKALKVSHETLEDALIDHREALVSSLSQRERAEDGSNTGSGETLREKLQALSDRRKELETARDWFAVLAKAEALGLDALQALVDSDLPQAFQSYVVFVQYVGQVYAAAPGMALSSHLGAMAASVWSQMVKVLSGRLAEKLEAISWPTPQKVPLDWSESAPSIFRTAFIDLLKLEKTGLENPLPGRSIITSTPLLALIPLVHPLLLRFRWHFDSERGTNRIDKPEYPLSHVLNLLSTHERFFTVDIQGLLDSNGFSDVDAINDFTSLLLPSLSNRIKHHIPQLLGLPPVLAHTIYQLLDFDAVLRTRSYHSRASQEWAGLSEIILGKKEWYNQWLEGEREFFDSRYYAAISAPDAMQIISESDYDAADARSAIRPTKSALAVADLAQQLADRYRPLPIIHTLPFLLSLHLPLLSSYNSRLASSLDAFESLSFGLILPGALADSRSATAGVGGVVRLARAGVSARWMSEKCSEWGEDAFFLTLYQYVSTQPMPQDWKVLAQAVVASKGGSVFDNVRTEYLKQADRAEELIVRHVAREVLADLKSYLGRRWDLPPPEEEEEPSLTSDLIAPLSLFSALLSSIVASFPATLATTLYRRISASLSQSLYDRLLINRTWSEYSAQRLVYDVEHGFLQAGREAGIKRGVGKGWEVFVSGSIILALPASTSSKVSGASKGPGFSKVMQVAFDDGVGVSEEEGSEFRNMMDSLGVGEVLRKKNVQGLMKRRPECWR